MDNPRFERYLTSPPRSPGRWEARARRLCDELAHKIGLRQLKPRTALIAGVLIAVLAGFGLVRSGVFSPPNPGSVAGAETPLPALAARATETTVTVHVVVDQSGAVSVAGGEAGAVAPAQPGRGADGRINLNTADEQTLETLPGVGPATAQKIVSDRAANGPFASPEDLMRVPGIGPKKYDAVKDLICALR